MDEVLSLAFIGVCIAIDVWVIWANEVTPRLLERRRVKRKEQ